MPEQRTKKYVEVIADFSPEGILTPQTVIWDTGQRFDITCISEVLPRKYSKTGGVGVRYTCQIGSIGNRPVALSGIRISHRENSSKY